MINLKTGYKVSDIMAKKPIIVSPNMSVAECARLMKLEDVGSLVIGTRKQLKGIVIEQDFVHKVIANNLDTHKTKVKKVMVSDVITTHPDTDLFDAIQMMSDYNIRHMPVLKDDKVVGYLTLKDVLRVEPQLCELIMDKFSVRESDDQLMHIERDRDGNEICPMCGK